VIISLINLSCTGKYHTFADRPGFDEYYRDRCRIPPPPVTEKDRLLLEKYRPRFVLPPGGSYPLDFYRDYLPHTELRSWPDGEVLSKAVTRNLLLEHRTDHHAYLRFDVKGYRAAGLDVRWERGAPPPGPEREPVVYGRVYRERVSFPDGNGGKEEFNLTFLKYNLVFATSGLPEKLPLVPKILLSLGGVDREDWHVLDNFVAAHVVLDAREKPIAVILAQHNDHRTYLLGPDIPFTTDGRPVFDIALRSNEVYPDSRSPQPALHRVIRWSLYLDYLLSGENPPLFKGWDMTFGLNAGGGEFHYKLKILPPCDPLYTSEMLLGQPRPFFGLNLGRDGPPGMDYYSTPELLPMGNLLKFGYLHDGDPNDIAVVRRAIDWKAKTINIKRILQYGGRSFLEDWKELNQLKIEN